LLPFVQAATPRKLSSRVSHQFTTQEKGDLIRRALKTPEGTRALLNMICGKELESKEELPILVGKLEDILVTLISTAEGVYDVSGETGKDLIDSAHEGNMHTEVSGRKDDDGNLVETIFERQETDIEVAHANPKGTYATLMDLRGRLSAKGHADVVAELDEAIKLVATPEAVFEYTLISLACELDKRGFVEVADKVDELIRKTAEPFDKPVGMSGGGVHQKSQEELNREYFAGKGSDSSWLTQEPVVQNPNAAETQKPQTLDFTGEQLKPFDVGLKPDPKVAEVGKKFQTQYNILMRLKYPNDATKLLKVDGVWGPATNKAWKDVGGSWGGLNKLLQENSPRQQYETSQHGAELPSTQYAPPMAPLPPGTKLPEPASFMPPTGTVMSGPTK
jgi:hypothetical protein